MNKNPTYEALVQRVRELEQGKSEHKKMEKALLESEDKFRRLYHLLRLMSDNVPDLIWAKDLEGKFQFVNHAMCEKLIMCDNPDLAIGKTDLFFAEQQRNAGYKHSFGDQCVDSDTIVKEKRDPGRFLEDGFVQNKYLVLDVHKAPLFNEDGEMIGTVGCGRDVTKEKKIEKALQASENRLKAFADASFEAIFFSEKGVCLDQNQTAERLFGYTLDEAVGRHGTEWIVPEERAMVRKHMLSGHKKPYKVTALRNNGTTFPAEIQARMAEYQGRSIRITALRDITERKRVEEELERSEERFRNLAEMLPEAVFESDRNLVLTYANQRAFKMFGYSIEDLDAGLNCLELLSLEDRDRATVNTAMRLEGKSIGSIEYQALRKDGTSFPILLHANAIVKKGEVLGFRGIIVDMTERKRREDELKESEQRLRNVLETLELIAVTLDNKGKITFCNDYLLNLTGWRRDEVLGKSWFETFLPSDIRDEIETSVFIKSIEMGSFPSHYTNKIITKSGKRRLIKWSNTVLRSPQGGILESTSIGEDITERKRTEQRLRQSKKEWGDTFAAMSDWVTLVDLDGKIRRSNCAVRKIFGVNQTDMIGKQCCEVVPGSDSAISPCPLKLSIQTHLRESIEIHIPEKNQDLSITVDPVFDESGNMVSAVHIVRDITKRKKTEKELKISASNLGEANSALKIMLEQRDREKKGLETNFAESVNGLILPYLERIKKTKMNDLQKGYMDILESNLKEIIKPYTHRLSINLMHLSPSETRIVNYIKQGYRNKEIASILKISLRTIEFHRDNIRKKLGIKNRKINLKTYLLNIS